MGGGGWTVCCKACSLLSFNCISRATNKYDGQLPYKAAEHIEIQLTNK